MPELNQLRASAQPRPADWTDPYAVHDLDHRAFAAVAAGVGLTFFADVSTYQPLVDSSYPYPVFGFRADSGSSTDSHADGNWGYCDQHPDRILAVLAYIVFKPGRSGAIFTRLKNLFGSQCPPQVVPEIDMESGVQFAGPGDHSVEANDFIATLAGWSGKQARTQGYANAPDWAGNWPRTPVWMKRRLAAYSSQPTAAGYYSRQYYGALPYASPAGYPRSCPPFGGYVDMNVIPRSIDQILVDYGIGAPVATLDADDLANIANAVWHHKMQGNLSAQYQADVLITDIRNGELGKTRDAALAAAAGVSSIAAKVGALTPAALAQSLAPLLVAALPNLNIPQAELEAALRNVLGSLDD